MGEEIAETALEFASECMGWNSPDICGPKLIREWNQDDPGKSKLFDFNDLNAVMAAVETWCPWTWLIGNTGASKDSYYVEIRDADAEIIGESYYHLNKCHALLSACVKSARKIKERQKP